MALCSTNIKPPKGKEWVANEVHLMDNKLSKISLRPEKKTKLAKRPSESRGYASFLRCYLQPHCDLVAFSPLFFQRIHLLRVLDLSDTNIKSLPKSLPLLSALRKLFLRRCKLFMELSPMIGKLKKLEELDLVETQIMDLPREIGELVKLRHLRVSFYGHANCSKKRLLSNIVIHPDALSNLSQLVELSIDVDPADKRWDESLVEAVVKEVCNLKALRSLRLYLPKVQLLDDCNSNGKSLMYPSLSCFRFIVGYQKRRIISRVPPEVEAQFRKWEKCLKFVNGGNIPIEIKGVLKHSTSFFLDNHATAVNLSEFGIENMKRLKFCLLAECNKMETIVDGEKHFKGDEKEQSEADLSSAEHGLESLQYLRIYYMKNLGSICRGPIQSSCMSKLKFLALHTCPRLSTIFSHDVLENFVNLEECILEDCPQVTSLVSQASIKPISDNFLPSLKRLLLLYLPELISISNGLLIAPKLECIGFYNCPKLKSISKTELSSKTLKKIKGESSWWEDIKWKGTDYEPRLDYLTCIFSPISNDRDVMTQLVEDGDLSESSIQKEGLLQDTINQPWCNKDGCCFIPSFISLNSDRVSTNSHSLSRPSKQAWSFHGPAKRYGFSLDHKNKRLEDEYFAFDTLASDVYEDEPQAKRWKDENEEDEKDGIIISCSRPFGVQENSLSRPESDITVESDITNRKDSKTFGVRRSYLLGPESDITVESNITNKCNSFKNCAHHAGRMASLKRAQLVELIPGLDLKQVLVDCGKAVYESDMSRTENLMHILEQMVSVSGEPMQRLGAYVLEALRARLEFSGSNIYKALKCKELNSELLSYMDVFYQISPFRKFAFISANVVIKEVMENEPVIHIIDFQIGHGSQWVFLIAALAKCPNGPPFIRITGFDDSISNHTKGEGLSIVGQRLSNIAESYDVPFKFHDASIYGYEVELEHLMVQPGEALAVNFPFVLHQLPDESVSSWNHRDRLLRLVKSLSPKVVTLVEQELNTNTSPFFARFLETLDYYEAVFESIDVAKTRDHKLRIKVEQHCMARCIVNIIACEGLERVERHELFGKWRSRFMMAGFSPYPLSSSVTVDIEDLLKEYGNNFRLENREGALFLGWGNRPLTTSSAWR